MTVAMHILARQNLISAYPLAEFGGVTLDACCGALTKQP